MEKATPILQDFFLLADGANIKVDEAFSGQEAEKAVELTNELLSRNFSNLRTSTEEIAGTKNILLKIGDLEIKVGYNSNNTRAYLNDLQEIFDAVRSGDTEGLKDKYEVVVEYGGSRSDVRKKELERRGKNQDTSKKVDYSNL
jgi:hypothetical protein